MSNFATLKKSSTDISRLTREIEKINAPSNERQEDTRFWKLERDKSGNGSAIIRFLPSSAIDGQDSLPWVRIFDHGFKGASGKWYIENSLTTLGQKDPVSEFNSKLWNSTSEDNHPNRKQARDQKRRLHYISNILVVSDQKHPENEGKVFLFKFGKKIFDKITLAMNPEFDGDKPVNPFDLWNGANFKIRMRTVEGYPNYDMSAFESASPLSTSDEELEKIWKSEYSLKEFLDPKNFKSYDDLKRKLEDVLGTSVVESKSEKTEPTIDDLLKSKKQTAASDDAEDDELSYFASLAQE